MRKPNDRRVLSPSNLRCRICNVVSHADIASDYGDHSESAFYEEEDGLGYVCHECHVAITSAIDDFSVDDEFDEDFEYYELYGAEDDA